MLAAMVLRRVPKALVMLTGPTVSSWKLIPTKQRSPIFSYPSQWQSLVPFNRLAHSFDDITPTEPAPMEYLYQQWTLEQDQVLWENRNKPISKIAAILGRGLRGTEQRLAKLKDPNNMAYQRLFCQSLGVTDDERKNDKLVPVVEVLQRIKWDTQLPCEAFSVLYYDRVNNAVLEASFDAPNTSIAGRATTFIDALPEHRIVSVKFKERVVWDRDSRLDLVFSGPGIRQVVEEYDSWKAQQLAAEALAQQREQEVVKSLQNILGIQQFEMLKHLSQNIQTESLNEDGISVQVKVQQYIRKSLSLFRHVRDDPTECFDSAAIPNNDYDALDKLSEIVALLPNTDLRPIILDEIARAMQRAKGVKPSLELSRSQLPELNEEELTESFVRGSGPGGQR